MFLSSLILGGLLSASSVPQDTSPYRSTLERGKRALEAGDLVGAGGLARAALERDPLAPGGWDLLARWAEATDDPDLQVYARHQHLRRAELAGASRRDLDELREALSVLDPLAPDLHALRDRFHGRLSKLAKGYDEDRPHAAIRAWRQLLALDPLDEDAASEIDRIASRPDPSLAAHARPKDLMEGVDPEWVLEHDARHATWDEAARVERENYTTITNAGYEVLVRTAEVMEQVNVFYREFFQYGSEEDGRSVPRIQVRVFATQEEYLDLGSGPPAEWSGGQFTGGAVETFVDSGFEAMVGVLFHEAAHQFVSLATTAVGWLNEGLASFFEGTRILPNGTVVMNLPASHRLIPLATRMEAGWMESSTEGMDPGDPSVTPERAPTFRIVLEDEYGWGPPWYAPTWGVVFFLYNFQDAGDGRFVYREAFREYIDKSGGKSGKTAVSTFEEVVLGNPKPPYPKGPGSDLEDLPRDVDALNDLWRDWILALRDEVEGRGGAERPYLVWGQAAAEAGEFAVASEHFERGLLASPDDVELRVSFAELLADEFENPDRAAKLLDEAVSILEVAEAPDEKRIRDLDRRLRKLDPDRDDLEAVQRDLASALAVLADRYASAGLDRMVMDVTWRGAVELELDALMPAYEAALRRVGEGPAIWELAYDEESLKGWVAPGTTFRADGRLLRASYGPYDEEHFKYRMLRLDRVTAGDFSLEAKVQADRGDVNFCGFVFGSKGPGSFHAALLFPPRTGEERNPDIGYVDLASWRGEGVPPRTWIHAPVDMGEDEGRSSAGRWWNMRLDVVGNEVLVWFEGRLAGAWEFTSREVLWGSFGLLCGPGKCAFRDVRFLARSPRDPAGRIEREVRLAAIGDGTVGSALDGSWRGRIPPFPRTSRWFGEERTSWEEGFGSPQVLVFWSQEQNQRLPIDGWLRSLQERGARWGTRIVSIVSAFDSENMESYLEAHPFPGAVGVDERAKTQGMGETFEEYLIPRFGMPRVILLDLDGKVLWEGDPGFAIGREPRPPYSSYLDDPMEDLIERRKLRELARWREAWDAGGRQTLEAGDLPGVSELLLEAEQLGQAGSEEARRAHAVLVASLGALADAEGTASSLERLGGAPALQTLADWGEVLEVELDRDASKALSRALRDIEKTAEGEAWRRVKALGARYGKRKIELPELTQELRVLEGALVQAVLAGLESGEEDVEELIRTTPGRWLVLEYLRFGR